MPTCGTRPDVDVVVNHPAILLVEVEHLLSQPLVLESWRLDMSRGRLVQGHWGLLGRRTGVEWCGTIVDILGRCREFFL